LNKLVVLTTVLLLISSGCITAPKQDPGSPGPAQIGASYSGSELCRFCHPTQHRGWAQSGHARMVVDAKRFPEAVISDFSLPGNPFEVATEFGPDDVILTIGGKWKQRYVVHDPEARAWRLLPAEWITATGSWRPYNADKWNERDYGDLCTGCHNTGYEPKVHAFVEGGIGCESCHGPGAAHIASRNAADLVNPKNLEPERAIEVCAQCHIRGKNVDGKREDALGYVPGEKLLDHYKPLEPNIGQETDAFFADGSSKKHHQQYQDYIQSTHWTKQRMTCTSCHAPHAPTLLVALGNEVCTGCHKPQADVQKHTGQSVVTDCVTCHMPKRATSATEMDIRSHTFKLNQPGPAPKPPYGE